MGPNDETGTLLELLREAGDEAVTLGELEVVGVRDPARALLELELAGHAVHRVYENPARGQRLTCVRLATTEEAGAAAAAHTAAAAERVAAAAAGRTVPEPRPVSDAEAVDRRESLLVVSDADPVDPREPLVVSDGEAFDRREPRRLAAGDSLPVVSGAALVERREPRAIAALAALLLLVLGGLAARAVARR